MSLLNEIVKDLTENAAAGATSAHAVGAYAGSLFGGGVVQRNKRRLTDIHRIPVKTLGQTIKNRNKWKWRIIGEMVQDDSTFDTADVMSKLDSAEKQSRLDQDTIPFGMEDEEGNIVKVYVRAEQADEFEQALASMLAGEDAENDNDEETDAVEIAEVLFQLKDKFEIVDVEWPHIEGDVEEEQEVEGGEKAAGEMPGGEGDLEGGDEAPGLGDETGEGLEDLEGGEGEGLEDLEGGEGEGDAEMEPEGGIQGTLQDVIDMLKQEAEARKAEAEAKAKEAEARAAEANANASMAKVKQEEDVLDMENFNKRQKEEEEESKQLAKLAKWKHDQATRHEAKISQEEEEAASKTYDDKEPNRTRPNEREDRTITKDELARHIMDYLRAN